VVRFAVSVYVLGLGVRFRAQVSEMIR